MIRPVFAEIVGLVAVGLQSGADVGGAAVLPDDGAVHGLAGGAVPHHGGLALVGDADRGDVLCRQRRPSPAPRGSVDRRGPDVLRLVLDPAGGREMLREFLLRGRGDRDVAAKHDGARGRGALIDGEDEGHGCLLPGGDLWLRPREADWEGTVNIWPTSRMLSPRGEARRNAASSLTSSGAACATTRPGYCRRASHDRARARLRATGMTATPTPSSRRRRRRWSGRS